MIIITKNKIDYNYQDTIISNKQQSQPSLNMPCSFRFVHSIPLFLLSLTFLLYVSSFPPFIGFLTQNVQPLTVEYTSSCYFHKTTCILARRVSYCNRPRQLTSYDYISHSSPDCHPSLLCYGYFLMKRY